MKSKISPLLAQIIIYLVQYILLPLLITIYPSDAERSNIAIFTTTMLISLICMALLSDKIGYWLLSIPVYAAGVFLYHPDSLYGIGYGMFGIEWISIIYITILVLIYEVASWILIKILKKLLFR